MSLVDDIANAAPERGYVDAAGYEAKLDAVREGKNPKNGFKYVAFDMTIVDALDDEGALEPGDLVSIYKDLKYEDSALRYIKNVCASIVTAATGTEVNGADLEPAQIAAVLGNKHTGTRVRLQGKANDKGFVNVNVYPAK